MSFGDIVGRTLALLLGALVLTCILGSSLDAALAGAQPVELAAPYEYLGWGSPQPPAGVLAATGV
jgi:hypothetical protein